LPVPDGIAAVMPTILSSFSASFTALAEHVLVGRRVRFGLCLRAGGDVELDDGVILVGRGFRRA